MFTKSHAGERCKDFWKNYTMAESSEEGISLPPLNVGRFAVSCATEDRRKREFRSLVGNISEHLEPKDIKSIVWQEQLPSSLRERSALDVLEHLYKHGKFSEYEVRPLAQLLKDIYREDLTAKVDAFRDVFGESFPKPNQSTKPLVLVSHDTLTGASLPWW